MSWFTINLFIRASDADITSLQKGLERIMTTVAELNQKLDALNTATAAERQEVLDALNAFKTQIQALKDQIAAGTPASQADLDALGARIDEQVTKVQGIINASDTQS